MAMTVSSRSRGRAGGEAPILEDGESPPDVHRDLLQQTGLRGGQDKGVPAEAYLVLLRDELGISPSGNLMMDCWPT